MYKAEESVLKREFSLYTEDEIMHVTKKLEQWGFNQFDLPWIFGTYSHSELLSECDYRKLPGVE